MKLLVIAKAPRPGRSKTRLCPPCTPAQAASLAEASLGDTLDAVRATPGAEPILILDGEPGRWLPPGIPVIPQRGTGLDERLAAAFEDAGAPAFLVGMDTPQLSPTLLNAAVVRLGRPSVGCVLGPAMDGGWWGIGLRTADPRAFLGVPMSTSSTVEHQRRRLEELGLRIGALPVLRDVDLFEDAIAVAANAPDSRFAQALARVNVQVEVGAGT